MKKITKISKFAILIDVLQSDLDLDFKGHLKVYIIDVMVIDHNPKF